MEQNTTINNSIPSEVLFNIFQYTSKNDLFQCLKVCRFWYSLATPLFWETIELNTVDQANNFLQHGLRDTTKFTKHIIFGYQDISLLSSVGCSITTEQVKQILFRLPNIEEIKINKLHDLKLAEMNNDEFLNEFRKRCPHIKSFEVCSDILVHQMTDYEELLYSLRYSLTNIKISNSYTKLYKQIDSFPQLIHFGYSIYHIDYHTLLELFNKIKMLPYLKSIDFKEIRTGDQVVPFDMHNIRLKTEQDDTLKQKLGSLEKLYIKFRGYNVLYELNDFIQQYFVGLKDIEITYELIPYYDGFDKWLKYIYSHDLYKLNIIGNHDILLYELDTINFLLQNHHVPSSLKNMTNQIQICLSGTDINLEAETPYVYPNTSFKIKIESKQLNSHQFLRSTNLHFYYNKEYADTMLEIFRLVFTSIIDIDTLVFRIDRYDYFPLKSLELIGKTLSVTADFLKKVIFYLPSGSIWNEYFVHHIQTKILHHVTHLEIFVDNDPFIPMDNLALFQIPIKFFPCIKYLTLQYFSGIWDLNNHEFFINLPQVNLKRLTLDINNVKKQAKIKWYSNFSDECFILKVEANKKMFEYQVSLDFLNISKVEKDDGYFGFLWKKKYPTLHVMLESIECLEMFLLSDEPDIELQNFEKQNFLNYYYSQKTVERRIYFK